MLAPLWKAEIFVTICMKKGKCEYHTAAQSPTSSVVPKLIRSAVVIFLTIFEIELTRF